MAELITVTRGELLARREAVLARIGMTAADLAVAAANSVLPGELYAAVDELDDLAFLLGEEPFPPRS